MARIVISEKKKWVQRPAKNMSVKWAFPKIVLDLIEPKDLATEAAMATASKLKANWSKGRDANGKQYHPSEATKRSRKKRLSPPSGKKRKGAVNRRKPDKRTGKPRRVRPPGAAFKKRYPAGNKASLGQDVMFVDSGLLRDSLRVSGSGAGPNVMFVTFHKKRSGPVNIMNKKYNLFTAIGPPLDLVTDRVLKRMAKLDDVPLVRYRALYPGIELERGGI